MVPLMGDIVILGLGSKMAGLGEPGLAKQIEGAVDRRQADMGFLFGQQPVLLLGRDMLHLEKSSEDLFPLAGEFELVLSKVLFENVNLFHVFGHAWV